MEVPVGLETDYRSFHNLPDVQSTMHCLACGDLHVWSTESAMLSGDDLQIQPRSERRSAA
jgi:hypothetical protein